MKITIYTIKDCAFSKQEKEYLNTNKLVFEEKDLETNKDFLTEMLAISNNFAGTPVTRVEKDDGTISVLKGFTKGEFDAVFGFTPTPSTSSTTTASDAPPDASPTSPTQVVNDTPPIPPISEVPPAEPVSPAPVPTDTTNLATALETPKQEEDRPLNDLMDKLNSKMKEDDGVPTAPTPDAVETPVTTDGQTPAPSIPDFK